MRMLLLLLWMLTVGMSAEDEALIAGLEGRACLVVWNKSDLVELGRSGFGLRRLLGMGLRS